jgi:hypothetical protein
MKKGIILLSALFLIAGAAVADVTAVKDGEGAKVTFTYTPDYDAAFVGLVGDFQGWNLDGAVPMTKNDDGSWSVTLDATADQTILYKFNVDGEWTEDANAPAVTDDGFGGFNGKAVVAELLLGPAATGPKYGLQLGTYTFARSETTFEEDALLSQIHAGSYLKLRGYMTENFQAYVELAVLETLGTPMTVYSEADTDDEFKWRSLADIFFKPQYELMQNKNPYLGHLMLGWDFEYADVKIYNKFAKATVARDIYYSLYTGDLNADQGVLEATKELDLGVLPLEYYVALSYRSGLRGFQSYVATKIDGKEAQLMFNLKEVASSDIEYFFGNVDGQVALSSKGQIISGLKYNFGAALNIFNDNRGTLVGTDLTHDPVGLNTLLLGLQLGYVSDSVNATLKTQLDGANASLDSFFGKNDDGDAFAEAELGNFQIDLDVNTSELLGDIQVGLDLQNTLDEELKPSTDSGNLIATEQKLYGSYTDYGLYVKTQFNEGASEAFGFGFKEVGVSAVLPEFTEFIQPTLYAAYEQDLSWNGADEAYQTDQSYIHFIATSGVIENLTAHLGVLVRLDGENTIDPEDQIGFSIGTQYKLGSWEFFGNFGYKSDLFEDSKENGGLNISDSTFDTTSDLDAANAQLVIGAKIEL